MTTEQTTEHETEEQLEELQTRNTLLQAEVKALRPVATREAIRSAGVDPDSGDGKALADMLGDQPATVEKVKQMADRYGFETQDPESIPTRPAQPTASSIDEQIAAAEEEGDYLTAGQLKLLKHKERQEAAAPAPDEATRQKIAEAEESGDFLAAGQLKVGALASQAEDLPEAPASSDLDAQIAEAEEAGDWAKAGTLKLQRMAQA